MAKLDKERDYPVIASMYRSGMKTGAIAPVFGIHPDYLSSLKSKILAKSTVGDVKVSDIGKAQVLKLALTGSKDEVKLNAAKALVEMDTGAVVDPQSSKSDDSILIEIKRELGSVS